MSTGGKSTVAGCINYQWLLEFRIRQGQVVQPPLVSLPPSTSFIYSILKHPTNDRQGHRDKSLDIYRGIDSLEAY